MKHSQKRIFMDIEKMTSDEFKAFCRSGNKNYFTRIRKMPLQDLLFTMINRKGLTLALELRNYMKLAHPGVSISKPGYLKQRMKLNPDAFLELYKYHNRNFYADSTFSTYKDHLILAADGSDINIPTTAETLKLYGSASRKNTKPQAQIGLGCIYDVMNRMILESDCNKVKFNEMRLAEKQMERIPETIGSIPYVIIMDRGYKTDDPRYQAVLDYVRKTLLPDILKMRDLFVSLGKKKKEEKKLEQQRQNEASFKKSVDTFRKNTAKKAAQKISSRLGISTEQADEVEAILSDEINTNSPDMGIKSIIDSQKKKLLISQTYRDKDLADIIYNMLVFNNVPPEDIIYTNCDDEVSRIPEGDVGKSGIYDYLRDFFVDSYSTQKIYVIFVTSHNTKSSWGALMEVGAAWITQVEHKIFNIYDFRPEHPLDDEQQWHSSSRDDDGNLYMSKLSVDIFAQKIEYICDKLGYKKRTRQENKDHLSTLVKVTPR